MFGVFLCLSLVTRHLSLLDLLENVMTDWEPKITTFLCNWCSYGAADLAGVSRFQYPPNFRVIRIPCSARVSPKFILAALRRGADGVWVSG